MALRVAQSDPTGHTLSLYQPSPVALSSPELEAAALGPSSSGLHPSPCSPESPPVVLQRQRVRNLSTYGDFSSPDAAVRPPPGRLLVDTVPEEDAAEMSDQALLANSALHQRRHHGARHTHSATNHGACSTAPASQPHSVGKQHNRPRVWLAVHDAMPSLQHLGSSHLPQMTPRHVPQQPVTVRQACKHLPDATPLSAQLGIAPASASNLADYSTVVEDEEESLCLFQYMDHLQPGLELMATTLSTGSIQQQLFSLVDSMPSGLPSGAHAATMCDSLDITPSRTNDGRSLSRTSSRMRRNWLATADAMPDTRMLGVQQPAASTRTSHTSMGSGCALSPCPSGNLLPRSITTLMASSSFRADNPAPSAAQHGPQHRLSWNDQLLGAVSGQRAGKHAGSSMSLQQQQLPGRLWSTACSSCATTDGTHQTVPTSRSGKLELASSVSKPGMPHSHPAHNPVYECPGTSTAPLHHPVQHPGNHKAGWLDFMDSGSSSGVLHAVDSPFCSAAGAAGAQPQPPTALLVRADRQQAGERFGAGSPQVLGCSPNASRRMAMAASTSLLSSSGGHHAVHSPGPKQGPASGPQRVLQGRPGSDATQSTDWGADASLIYPGLHVSDIPVVLPASNAQVPISGSATQGWLKKAASASVTDTPACSFAAWRKGKLPVSQQLHSQPQGQQQDAGASAASSPRSARALTSRGALPALDM